MRTPAEPGSAMPQLFGRRRQGQRELIRLRAVKRFVGGGRGEPRGDHCSAAGVRVDGGGTGAGSGVSKVSGAWALLERHGRPWQEPGRGTGRGGDRAVAERGSGPGHRRPGEPVRPAAKLLPHAPGHDPYMGMCALVAHGIDPHGRRRRPPARTFPAPLDKSEYGPHPVDGRLTRAGLIMNDRLGGTPTSRIQVQ